MVEPMTEQEARDYAPQWGSMMRAGDPGACMYGDSSDPATALAMVRHIDSDLMPLAKGREKSGEADSFIDGDSETGESDSEALARLRAYLVPIARRAPIETIEGVGRSHWASYFVNGDSSGMDKADLLEADSFEAWLVGHGGSIVDCESESFFARPDYPNGALAGDCVTYTGILARPEL